MEFYTEFFQITSLEPSLYRLYKSYFNSNSDSDKLESERKIASSGPSSKTTFPK
jgi:hypothetical protein